MVKVSGRHLAPGVFACLVAVAAIVTRVEAVSPLAMPDRPAWEFQTQAPGFDMYFDAGLTPDRSMLLLAGTGGMTSSTTTQAEVTELRPGDHTVTRVYQPLSTNAMAPDWSWSRFDSIEVTSDGRYVVSGRYRDGGSDDDVALRVQEMDLGHFVLNSRTVYDQSPESPRGPSITSIVRTASPLYEAIVLGVTNGHYGTTGLPGMFTARMRNAPTGQLIPDDQHPDADEMPYGSGVYVPSTQPGQGRIWALCTGKGSNNYVLSFDQTGLLLSSTVIAISFNLDMAGPTFDAERGILHFATIDLGVSPATVHVYGYDIVGKTTLDGETPLWEAIIPVDGSVLFLEGISFNEERDVLALAVHVEGPIDATEPWPLQMTYAAAVVLIDVETAAVVEPADGSSPWLETYRFVTPSPAAGVDDSRTVVFALMWDRDTLYLVGSVTMAEFNGYTIGGQATPFGTPPSEVNIMADSIVDAAVMQFDIVFAHDPAGCGITCNPLFIAGMIVGALLIVAGAGVVFVRTRHNDAKGERKDPFYGGEPTMHVGTGTALSGTALIDDIAQLHAADKPSRGSKGRRQQGQARAGGAGSAGKRSVRQQDKKAGGSSGKRHGSKRSKRRHQPSDRPPAEVVEAVPIRDMRTSVLTSKTPQTEVSIQSEQAPFIVDYKEGF